MDTNQILIIAFCSFSACGLLCTVVCLMCKYKGEEDYNKKRIKNIKIKPIEITYRLERPQREEMKDEHDENQLEIV